MRQLVLFMIIVCPTVYSAEGDTSLKEAIECEGYFKAMYEASKQAGSIEVVLDSIQNLYKGASLVVSERVQELGVERLDVESYKKQSYDKWLKKWSRYESADVKAIDKQEKFCMGAWKRRISSNKEKFIGERINRMHIDEVMSSSDLSEDQTKKLLYCSAFYAQLIKNLDPNKGSRDIAQEWASSSKLFYASANYLVYWTSWGEGEADKHVKNLLNSYSGEAGKLIQKNIKSPSNEFIYEYDSCETKYRKLAIELMKDFKDKYGA